MPDNSPRSRSKRTVLGLFSALLLLGGIIAVVALRHRTPDSTRPAVEGRNVLAGRDPAQVRPADLNQLHWEDIAPTLEAFPADAAARTSLARACTNSPHAPTRYLHALLCLATQQPEVALRLFQTLDVSQVPPNHLYAPYRLSAGLQPGRPNPFRDRLRQAVDRAEVPALTIARVEADDGRMPAALQAYLRTDPADWSGHDLELLQRIQLQAGLAPEVRGMLRVALRGNRLPSPLRPSAARLASATDVPAQKTLQSAVLRQMETNQVLQEAGGKAAIRLLETRRKFLARDYPGLVADYREADPLALPDETVLVVFLSAARMADRAAADRWLQEVRRRFPGPDVERWTKELQTSAK